MSKTITFTPAANPFFCYAVGGLIGLFGLGFLITGFDKIAYDPAWMIPQTAFGLILIFFAWRTATYHKRPVFTLTGTAIEQRPFWGLPRKTPFDQIDRLSLYFQANQAKIITPEGKLRKIGIHVMSQHLICRMTSGEDRTIVLPGFDNDALLDALKQRTGKSIEMLPGREAG